eukprot:8448835-Alexandrium_andersonii.AAC.1
MALNAAGRDRLEAMFEEWSLPKHTPKGLAGGRLRQMQRVHKAPGGIERVSGAASHMSSGTWRVPLGHVQVVLSTGVQRA